MKIRLILLSIFLLGATAAYASAGSVTPTNGSLIKGPDTQAVYYLGSDNKRYVFPNAKTYFSWYADFDNVIDVSREQLASHEIGGNVTYRPGMHLVKIQTSARVYAVSKNGLLRHIASESIASLLFGEDWSDFVHDIPDAFFVNYRIGSAVDSAAAYSPENERGDARSIDFDRNLGSAGTASSVFTSTPTPTSIATGSAPRFRDCQIFPDDNAWNQDIRNHVIHPNSDAYVATMGSSKNLHPDFDGEAGYGIPFVLVDGSQKKVPITFTAYGDESDPGPYPAPLDAPIEIGGDTHVITLDTENCILYELYASEQVGSGWNADSGAVWDLNVNDTRPDGWTSADAAGLPIFPGLVKYEDIVDGDIGHAIRFTTSPTQKGYIAPASHRASSNTNPDTPPMGLRMRLKASFDTSGYGPQARVILEGLKKYGMILADNGSDWFITGSPDSRWNNDDINDLKSVPGSAFEAVYTGEIQR